MKSLQILIILSLVIIKANAQLTGNIKSNVNPDEAKTAVNFHNKVRAEVGVMPLVWSDNLAAYAQSWADYLAENGCSIKHRPRSGVWKQAYGENIFWGSDSKSYSVFDACQGWYEEKSNFKGLPIGQGNFSDVGHYTQMVWSTTAAVGIGKSVCKDGALIVVANYDPPGNYVGQKPY